MRTFPVFEYATTGHVRRHGPRGYRDYRSFKPWLRDEFHFRCVACLFRERWFPQGHDAFSVEHHEPKSGRQELVCDYDNLLYLCNTCNVAKGASWPVPDPSQSALRENLVVRESGMAEGLTSEGKRLIDIYALNRPKLVEWRKLLLDMLEAGDTASRESSFRLGFPGDLPDLRILKVPSNDRPDGILDCYFARREDGRLPATY